MDFTDAGSWAKVYEGSFQAQMLPYYPKSHVPIADITLPITFNKNVLAITTISETAKQTWRLGIRAHPMLDVAGVFRLSGRYYATELNRASLILLPDITSDYKLRISIPKWFLDITVAVWVYQKEPTISNILTELDNLKTLVLNNRENIALIKSQLDRIEAKLDNKLVTNINTGFDNPDSSGSIGII